MNWYKKSSYSGEYWINKYGIEFADGNVGSETHESIVLRTIVNEHDIEYENWMDNESSQEELIEQGFTQQELEILGGRESAVDYAIKEWGWIAVRGKYVDAWLLDESTISRLSSGLSDISEDNGIEDIEEEEFEIMEHSTKIYIHDVPWKDIYLEGIQKHKMNKHQGLAPKTNKPAYPWMAQPIEKGVGLRDAKKYNNKTYGSKK